MMILGNRNDELRKASGEAVYSDPLTTFLYLLIRNELAAGKVEELVRESVESAEECTFTNGWLARYADNLAEEIRNSKANHLQTALEKAFTDNEIEKKEVEKEAEKKEIIKKDKDLTDVANENFGDEYLSELEQKIIQIAGVSKIAKDGEKRLETPKESAERAKDTVQELVDQGHMIQEDADDLKSDIDDVVKEEKPVGEAEEIVKEHTEDQKMSPETAKSIVDAAITTVVSDIQIEPVSTTLDLVEPIETQRKEQEEDDKEHEEEDRKAEKEFWKHWSENPDMSNEEYGEVIKAIDAGAGKDVATEDLDKWKTTNEELQKMEKETDDTNYKEIVDVCVESAKQVGEEVLKDLENVKETPDED